jgi:hypothetical protein
MIYYSKRRIMDLTNGPKYNRTVKKLRCNDGIVREFTTSQVQFDGRDNEIMCTKCKEEFGVHSWNAYKERLKEHVCK